MLLQAASAQAKLHSEQQRSHQLEIELNTAQQQCQALQLHQLRPRSPDRAAQAAWTAERQQLSTQVGTVAFTFVGCPAAVQRLSAVQATWSGADWSVGWRPTLCVRQRPAERRVRSCAVVHMRADLACPPMCGLCIVPRHQPHVVPPKRGKALRVLDLQPAQCTVLPCKSSCCCSRLAASAIRLLSVGSAC